MFTGCTDDGKCSCTENRREILKYVQISYGMVTCGPIRCVTLKNVLVVNVRYITSKILYKGKDRFGVPYIGRFM